MSNVTPYKLKELQIFSIIAFNFNEISVFCNLPRFQSKHCLAVSSPLYKQEINIDRVVLNRFILLVYWFLDIAPMAGWTILQLQHFQATNLILCS